MRRGCTHRQEDCQSSENYIQECPWPVIAGSFHNFRKVEKMHYRKNPFEIMPYRRQPNRRLQYHYSNQPLNTLAQGMVTFGSIAVIGGVTVGLLGAFSGK